MREKKIAFLLELEKLSKKHGIVVGSCGCCDSIHLDTIGEGGYWCVRESLDSLEWSDENDVYLSKSDRYERVVKLVK